MERSAEFGAANQYDGAADEEYVTTDSSSSSESSAERELVARQFLPPVSSDGFSFLKNRKSNQDDGLWPC